MLERGIKRLKNSYYRSDRALARVVRGKLKEVRRSN